MASSGYPPKLTLLENLDLIPAQLSLVASGIYAAITGIFRGNAGAKAYSKHILYAVTRRSLSRISTRQNQSRNPPTNEAYETFAKRRGFSPQTVELGQGALGHWIGNKDAKNTLVYYHGGGFALSADIVYFELFSDIIDELRNATDNDVAVFFVTYTLAPHAVYPTQMKQSVEALRYVVQDLNRPPSNVFLGGDSAGGNLTFAVLSHLSHPHPEIQALEISEPLGGAFAIAPWVTFSVDFPSVKDNAHKDMISPEALAMWSNSYLGGAKGDNYNQPLLAPADWWSGMKVRHVLIVAGSDEILLGGIEEFVEKLKSVFANTTYLVGKDESHIAPVFNRMVGDKTETAQAKGIQLWLSSRL